MLYFVTLYINENVLFLIGGTKMIIEVTFALAGGINFGLEKSWGVVRDLLKRYPEATWKKIVNRKKGKGKYIVSINE